LFDAESEPWLGLSEEKKETGTGSDVRPCAVFDSVTCTGVAGTEVGAVYRPEEVIVPVVGEPPATPLTCQVAFARLPLLPAAVNCRLWPGSKRALEGVTVGWLRGELVPLAQPENKYVTPKRKLDRKNRV
jgi:hypothetical protein